MNNKIERKSPCIKITYVIFALVAYLYKYWLLEKKKKTQFWVYVQQALNHCLLHVFFQSSS